MIHSHQLSFYEFLKHGHEDPAKMLASFNFVSTFMIRERKEVDDRTTFRIGRYMQDVYESANSLAAIKTHRTINGVRALSFIFISLFPIIQAQYILDGFGEIIPNWGVYLISFLTSIVLSALLHIQKQLEDPYKQEGLDYVQFEHFTLK